MSQHHTNQQWTKYNTGLRKIIAASLPAPCVDCNRIVEAGWSFSVGHIVDAMDGGTPTLDNVGPSHTRNEYWPINCGAVTGGRRGAQVVNNKRKEDKRHLNW